MNLDVKERIFKQTGKLYIPPRELTDRETAYYEDFYKKLSVKPTNKSRDILLASMRFYNYLAMTKANKFMRNSDLLEHTGLTSRETKLTAMSPMFLPDIKQFLVNEMQKDIGAAIPSASYYDANDSPYDPNTSDVAINPSDSLVEDVPADTELEVKVQNMLNESLKSFVRWVNPWATRKRIYLCLDSKYATFSEQNTRLTWDFTNSADQYNNSVNAIGKVRDIVRMKINSVVITQFISNVFNRATICVEEWRAQSFMMPSGRCFHFMGLLNDLNNQVPLTSRSALALFRIPNPITWNKYELLAGYRFAEGIYHFNNPITTINTMTLTFGSPITLLNIQKYININCRITNLTAGTDYAALTDLNILFPEPHYFAVEIAQPTIYSVYIQDFTTDNPVADKAVIDDINQNEFTICFVDTGTTMALRAFLIGLPGQSMFEWTARTPPSPSILVGNPTTCTLLINGYRIIINIELEMND
jgi:hypothetical protein